MTPPAAEGEALAREFHDTYERLAPQFGYETRADTKAFDPTTPNGRLMIAVCAHVQRASLAREGALREALRELVTAQENLHADSPRSVYERWQNAWANARRALSATPSPPPPIPMVLHCPKCGVQHIDGPQPEKGWDNPPHRSHECQSCGHIWRPCDYATDGVEAIGTKGSRDSATPSTGDAEREDRWTQNNCCDG